MYNQETGEQTSTKSDQEANFDVVSEDDQRTGIVVVTDDEKRFVDGLQAALKKNKANALDKMPDADCLKALATALLADSSRNRFDKVTEAVKAIHKETGVDPKKIARQIVKVSNKVFGEKVDRSWTSKAVCAAATVAVYTSLKDITDIERLAVLSRVPADQQVRIFQDGKIGDLDFRKASRTEVQDAVKVLKGAKKEPDRKARLTRAHRAAQKILDEVGGLADDDAQDVARFAGDLIKKIDGAMKTQNSAA